MINVIVNNIQFVELFRQYQLLKNMSSYSTILARILKRDRVTYCWDLLVFRQDFQYVF